MNRDEAKRLIENLGGSLQSKLTKKTDVLIIGDSPSQSKIAKARRLGIEIWDQVRLIKELES
jgi:DNA ligase (NAD+)